MEEVTDKAMDFAGRIYKSAKKAVQSMHNDTSKALWGTIMLQKKHPDPDRIIVVESSNPTPPKSGIELTPFDVWESRFPLPLVAVYRPGRVPSVETLVDGLEKLLALYPSLGGRVRLEGEGRDRAVVRFDKFERGVDVRARCKLILGKTETNVKYADKADSDIAKNCDTEWDRGLFDEKWIASVAVGLPIVTGKALFEVRLTPLADGGAILSACASHGLVDMQSMAQVLSDWGKLCRGEDVGDHHDKDYEYVQKRSDLILDESDRKSPEKKLNESMTSKKKRKEMPGFVNQMYLDMIAEMFPTVTSKTEVRSFNFTREDVNALKEVVKSGRAWPTFQEKGYRLSGHDVITAILWRSSAMIHAYHPQQEWGLVVVVNWRGKSHRIPLNYFGNATITPKTHRSMNEVVNELDLSECALIVRELGMVTAEEVEELILKKNRLQHGDGSEGSKGSSNIDRLINLSANSVKGCGLFISNFSKFDLYDVDFGLGKPDIVRFPHPPVPGFCYVYNSPTGNGDIKAVLTLYQEDSNRLLGLDYIKGEPIIDGKEEIPQADSFQCSTNEKINQAQYEQAIDMLYLNDEVPVEKK